MKILAIVAILVVGWAVYSHIKKNGWGLQSKTSSAKGGGGSGRGPSDGSKKWGRDEEENGER